MGIHSLEEDRVSQDGLEEGGVEAGEIIPILIDSVLGLVIVPVLQRGTGELRVTKAETSTS